MRHRPRCATLDVSLGPEERLIAASRALVTWDEHVVRDGPSEDGRVPLRAVGERGGRLVLAPPLPGDLALHAVGDEPLMVVRGAFLCAEAELTIDAESVALRVAGRGVVGLQAFGGLRRVEVDGTFVVAPGHVVAYDAALAVEDGELPCGWLAGVLAWRQLTRTFNGRGRVWVQTRSPERLARWVQPQLAGWERR